MAFVTRIWKDRQVEKPDRWKFINDDETETKYYTISRAEGTVDVIGDTIDAENMNDMEQRIADAFASVNDDITTAKNQVTTTLQSSLADMTAAQNTLQTNVTTQLNAAKQETEQALRGMQDVIDAMYTWDSAGKILTIHI